MSNDFISGVVVGIVIGIVITIILYLIGTAIANYDKWLIDQINQVK